MAGFRALWGAEELPTLPLAKLSQMPILNYLGAKGCRAGVKASLGQPLQLRALLPPAHPTHLSLMVTLKVAPWVPDCRAPGLPPLPGRG